MLILINKPDDHTVQKLCQATILGYVRKVWETSLQRQYRIYTVDELLHIDQNT